MLITEKLENQPNFPQEDLSETNALWLSMAIGNSGILQRGHQFAELQYRIFRATHRPLTIASENLFDSSHSISAIDFGIKALEAITLLVNADELEPDLNILESNINGIVTIRNKNGISDYFEEAQEAFLRETPRTAEVIQEGAARNYDKRLALLGGAIARQFEIDNISR